MHVSLARTETGNTTIEILQFAIEGRKRVKDQLLRIDDTYSEVNFGFSSSDGEIKVKTLEETEYPHYYHQTVETTKDETEEPAMAAVET